MVLALPLKASAPSPWRTAGVWGWRLNPQFSHLWNQKSSTELETCPRRGWPVLAGASWPHFMCPDSPPHNVGCQQDLDHSGRGALGALWQIVFTQNGHCNISTCSSRSLLVPIKRFNPFSLTSNLSKELWLKQRTECHESDAVPLSRASHRRDNMVSSGSLSQDASP